MNIGAFILRRLILQIFVLLGLSIFTFLLMFGLPGDPAAILYSAGGSLGFEEYNHFREKWGLDLPIWKQYTNFITNLMRGDMGTSLVTRTPIFDEIKSYFPATIELSIVAFIFACFSIMFWTLLGKFLRKFATNKKFIKRFNYVMSFLLVSCIATFYL